MFFRRARDVRPLILLHAVQTEVLSSKAQFSMSLLPLATIAWT